MNQQDSTLRQTAWLFTRQDKSVRLEIQSSPEGAVLLVSGPDATGARHDFTDFASLETFREGYERDLVARGFRLLAVAERRSEGDRRGAARPESVDRRR